MSTIVGLSITSVGTVVTLTKNSFHVYHCTHKSSIDTSIDDELHQESCSSIIADQSIRSCGREHSDHPGYVRNPSVFVSSCDALSSWEERCRTDGVRYYLRVSRIPLATTNGASPAQRGKNRNTPNQKITQKNSPTFSCISPCKTAIALCIDCSVEIIAVAKNLGLSHYSNFRQDTLVHCASLISSQSAPSLLVCIATGMVSIWDIIKRSCVKRINLQQYPSIPSEADPPSVLTTLFYPGETKGYLAFAHIQDFSLFLFEKKAGRQDVDTLSSDDDFNVQQAAKLQRIHDSSPLAISFVNDSSKLCILATKDSDILIIDRQQKCVIKKLRPDPGQKYCPAVFSAANISFPFVAFSSMSLPNHLIHNLDAVSVLVENFIHNDNMERCRHEDNDEVFKPLILEEENEDKFESKPSTIITCSQNMAVQNKGAHSHKIQSNDNDEVFKPLILEEENEDKFESKPSTIITYSQNMAVQNKDAHSHKIQSSGYAKNARLTKKEERKNFMVQRRVRLEKEASKRKVIYPITCSLLECHQSQHDDTENPCLLPPIATISFDPWGEFLATAHKDNSLHVFRLPFSAYKSASHQIIRSPRSVLNDASVGSLEQSSRPSWSHSRNFIAFHNRVHALSTNLKSLTPLLDLDQGTTNATFYAKDRFLLYTQKSSLIVQQLSSIHDDSGRNSLCIPPANSNLNKISLDCQNKILSIAAVNEVDTNLVGCACSDKSLHIFDIVKEKKLWSRPEASQSKAAHCITFPSPSIHVPLPPKSYNQLLAVSTDSGGLCTLWDLRSGRISASFRGHVNRSDRCMASFSPCMRYIGVGSEGACGSAVLYDLRGKTALKHIGRQISSSGNVGVGFRDDNVTDVQFNPLYPQLVTGSFTGQLRWYTEKGMMRPR